MISFTHNITNNHQSKQSTNSDNLMNVICSLKTQALDTIQDIKEICKKPNND